VRGTTFSLPVACAVRGMFGERGGRGDTVRVSTSYLDYDGMCINAPEGAEVCWQG